MTLFFDASAIVALMTREPAAPALMAQASKETVYLTSWLAVWEASTAVARKNETTAASALKDVVRYCTAGDIEVLAETRDVVLEAAAAYDRYGRRSGHPAALNMGDCFSLAFARTEGARLLYTGNDFAQIDLD